MNEPPTRSSVERYTVFAATDSAPVLLSSNDFDVAVYSHRSPAKDTVNEDAAAVVWLASSALLLVVADGIGGARSGDRAARIAIEQLIQRVEDVDSDDVLRERILSGLDVANESILELGIGAGTTVTCVSIRDGILRSYQIGDSMALVVGQRGKLKFQTVSHSPVGYLVESGVIDEDQALEHQDRHLVSNMVGSAEMGIELGQRLDLAARDTIIVASDGLSDNLLTEEIAEIARKGALENCAQQLVELAASRMADAVSGEPSKPDDLTFVLCRRRPD